MIPKYRLDDERQLRETSNLAVTISTGWTEAGFTAIQFELFRFPPTRFCDFHKDLPSC